MELTELYQILDNITGFKGKVAYRSFPVGSAPELPFICYLETSTDNAFADNSVYKIIRGIDIELYTETKDIVSESLLESALADAKIPWNKSETYLDTEKCYEIIYTVEV